MNKKILLLLIGIAFCIWGVFAFNARADEAYTYETQWGSEGAAAGQFEFPYSIATDASDNVYVTDTYNHRIQKFNSEGTFITAWGSEGSGDGQFSYPIGIAVYDDTVYIVDDNNHRIQKFNTSGDFITKWGSVGTGDGQFINPYGAAVDSGGNVYIADTFNQRIQKFTADGGFVTKWGSAGSGDGQFQNPVFIAIDSSDNVYVTDQDNDRVQKFSSSGVFITKWGTSGSDDGQFMIPLGIAVDSSDNIFVVDQVNNHVEKFDSDGTYLNVKIGEPGSGDGEFDGPIGVAVDSTDAVYVVDANNHRIQKFLLSNPAPVIDSLNPRSSRRGESLDVVIGGSGFVDGVTSVDFGEDITINSITVDFETAMTVNITIAPSADAGLRDVTVTNSAPGGGQAALADAFNVTSGGASGGGFTTDPNDLPDTGESPSPVLPPTQSVVPPVVIPSEIPTACVPYMNAYLRIGDSGVEVIKLQKFLFKEGSYPLGLITGYFGPLTHLAVKNFQVKYAADILTPQGLIAPTGIELNFTQTKINALICSGAVIL